MKKTWMLFLTFLSVFFLSSCALLPIFGGDEPSAQNPGFLSDNVLTYQRFEAKQKEDMNPIEGGTVVADTQYDYEEVQEAYYDFQTLPNKGNVKMLVLPIHFTDYTCSKLLQGCSNTRNLIGNAFFETSDKTGWESVASYYYKSSYGQLAISGAVLDWYQVGMTAKKAAAITRYNDPTIYILRHATEAAKAQLGETWKEYDSNQDGYIDAVWMVYSVDPQQVNEDVYWAYTYWDYEQSANLNSPNPQVYSWASYGFMYEGGYDHVDAHTYIHETGHLLGLDDYYSYDEDNSYAPAGGLDMMDYNIGDHNAFSKMSLGWLSPYHVTESTTIHLKPFESSGQCIVLQDSWSKTPFDNYIILEYYTPTGLNEQDAVNGYTGHIHMFRRPGIRIWQVDARLGTYQIGFREDTFLSYTKKIETGQKVYTKVAHSNTPSRSENENYFLLHLLEASGKNTMKSGKAATDDALFHMGDTFPTKTGEYASFQFNSGNAFPYTISFGMQSAFEAVVTITKK